MKRSPALSQAAPREIPPPTAQPHEAYSLGGIGAIWKGPGGLTRVIRPTDLHRGREKFVLSEFAGAGSDHRW